MAQKLQIDVELGVSGFNASLKDATAATTSLSDSAIVSAKKVEEAYQEVGKAQKAAFASSETSKALQEQNKSVAALKGQLGSASEQFIEFGKSGTLSLLEIKKQLDIERRDLKGYQNQIKETEKTLKSLNDQKLTTAPGTQWLTVEGNIKKATRELDKYKASAKQTEDQIELLKQSNENASFNKAAQQANSVTQKLTDLRKELRLLELAGKSNTKEFNNLAVSAAKLSNSVQNAKQAVEVLSSDTFVFDAAIDSVNALAGGFAVAQGAVGLFAEDNEDLQRAIAKTNSAMAILNGLQQVQAFVTGQSAGKLAILGAAQASYNFIVGASTGLLKLFRIALAATGVGLLVIAILSLYEAFQSNEEALKRNTKLYDDLNNSTTALRNNTIQLNKSLVDSNEELAVALGNLTQAEADRRLATREAFEEGLKENGQAIINISDAIQNEKFLAVEIIKAKSETLAAKAELDAKDTARNRGFYAKKLQDEKDLELKLSNLTTARVKLQSAVNDNIKARRKALSNVIKLIDIGEAKSNKEKNDKILKEEQAANLKRKQEYQSFLTANKILENEFNRQRQKETAEAFKKEGGILSITKRTELINTPFSEILTMRATFLKKEEAIGQGGLQNRIQIIDTERRAKIAAIREEIGFSKDANNQIAIINAQATEDVKAEYQRRAESILDIGVLIAAQLSQLNEISKEFTQRRIDSINEIAAAELSAINESIDTERNKQRQREALELRTNRKIAQEKRRQAQQDKALAIFNIVIDTAASIVKTQGNLGYPAAIPFQITAGIIGAAQLALVASRPLPKFAKGGEVKGRSHTQGGEAIEAEGGEYVIKRQRAKRFYQDAEAMNSGDYLAHIERAYVRPAVMDAILTVKREDQRVSVNARLDSRKMENEIQLLRRDSNKSNKIIAKALNSRGGSSSRYSWN